uniref:Uncharacterized protein n=1 Tax=Branchiostoma floridae TaxID=7739 RepID=C3Y3G2_BRAFL|eukprot:XP_002609219.1 hypothetical protein BRAFLDRAFT_90672 [Branchiostoma floridae]
MQAAGKTALSLVTSLCGRRSVVKLVKPPAGLPGVLLNSLHQDSQSPLTGPARNGHYKPTGQKGLSPADLGLLVGGVTIFGLGLYETYRSLSTTHTLSTASDVPSPAGVWYRTAAEPSLLEISKPEDTSGGSMSDDPTSSLVETTRKPEDTSGGSTSDDPTSSLVETTRKPEDTSGGSTSDDPTSSLVETTRKPEDTSGGSTSDDPTSSLVETTRKPEDTSGGSTSDDPTSSLVETTRKPEDTSGGSMSDHPRTPANEVPVAATNYLVESKKKPNRSARGKGSILYSSIDELESENMSASVQQYDLVVEKPTSPLHAGDLHATITEENPNEENQSILKAPDFLSSPPVDTRGHVCREAEDMGDGAYKGGAGYLVDGDDGRKSAGVHDGSGDHAEGEAHQGSKSLSLPIDHDEAGSCCHHLEATAPEKKQHRLAVTLAEMQEDDVIHTTCATEFRDHESVNVTLLGPQSPSPLLLA